MQLRIMKKTRVQPLAAFCSISTWVWHGKVSRVCDPASDLRRNQELCYVCARYSQSKGESFSWQGNNRSAVCLIAKSSSTQNVPSQD